MSTEMGDVFELAARVPVRTARQDDWQDGALCAKRDPEEWFAPDGLANTAANRDAAEMCRLGCPVREQCLAYALELSEAIGAQHVHGIWGGTSQRERRKAVAARRREKAAA